MRDLARHIRALSESVVSGYGCFIVDIRVETDDADTVLWMLVDAESGGLTLDTCSALSRDIGFLLDAHGVMDGRYRLNVSSPGLDRPLSDPRQYPKNVGRKIRLRRAASSSGADQTGETVIEGVLEAVDGSSIRIRTSGAVTDVPMEDISEAIIIPVF